MHRKIQNYKHSRQDWCFCKMQQKELSSNLLSLFHLGLPNHLHSISCSAISWAASLGMQFPFLRCYWILLLDCYPPRNCTDPTKPIRTKKFRSFVLFHFRNRDIFNSHYAFWIPDNGVSVECSSWIKPQTELLFFVPFSLCINIGVHGVRLARWIP